MRRTGKGYSTLFRELGTPEGDFHATFANHNAVLRRRMRTLAANYPNDDRLQSVFRDVEADRERLWESWKRGGLSPAMRRIVNSVRDRHHGPNLPVEEPGGRP